MKHPPRPTFRPTVPRTVGYVEPDTGIRIVDENPAYIKQARRYQRQLWRYKRAVRMYRLSTGQAKPTAYWQEEEIGLDVLRCPSARSDWAEDRPEWEQRRRYWSVSRGA